MNAPVQQRRHLPGGGTARRIQTQEIQPERIAGQCEHAAELAGAHDSDGHERDVARGSGLPRTPAVWRSRKPSSAAAMAGYLLARIAAAHSAALVAPAAPMANVATGTPAGICTIESKRIDAAEGFRLHRHAEHRQARLGRGHARQVRCAAGACDQHLEAARVRAGGVLEQQIGRAMRGHDAHLVGDRELLEHLGGALHGLPVGGGAHDDADERLHQGIVSNNVRKARNSSREAAPPAPVRACSLWAALTRCAH